MPIHPLSITIICKTCGTRYKAEIPRISATGETCKAEDLERMVEATLKHCYDPPTV